MLTRDQASFEYRVRASLELLVLTGKPECAARFRETWTVKGGGFLMEYRDVPAEARQRVDSSRRDGAVRAEVLHLPIIDGCAESSPGTREGAGCLVHDKDGEIRCGLQIGGTPFAG